MPERMAFEAAIIRIVPRVEREEFMNAGAIVYCRARRYLRARVALDWARLDGFAPGLCDRAELEEHLAHLVLVCEGDPAAGEIAALSVSERFQWLVAPRSTMIQCSAVHAGYAVDPDATLEHLMHTMVRLP
ncbi:MAG: DUF3037 domain-containing protein [Chloroflexi bacterium]|nr:DUF3037 domain-containing protein [Chloroflexota bacterium]